MLEGAGLFECQALKSNGLGEFQMAQIATNHRRRVLDRGHCSFRSSDSWAMSVDISNM